MTVVVLLALGQFAFATGKKDPPVPDPSANATAEQTQVQLQGQKLENEIATTATGGEASAYATGGSNSLVVEGSQQAVSFNSPDDITLRNTAAPFLPSVYPTGSCYGGWSAGVGVPGFNIGGGKAKKDAECDARETARFLDAFGERELAIELLCTTAGAAALGDRCAPSTRKDEIIKRQQATIDELNQLRADDVAKCNADKSALTERCFRETNGKK